MSKLNSTVAKWQYFESRILGMCACLKEIIDCKLGGYRNNNGNGFYNLGSWGNWWSSTPYSSNNAWCRYLTSEADGTVLNQNNGYNRSNGFSVRCLRNLREMPFKIRDDGLEMKDDGVEKD